MRIGRLHIQYHRMPKYLGKWRTTVKSHIRFFWQVNRYDAKFLFDIRVPKYGRG